MTQGSDSNSEEGPVVDGAVHVEAETTKEPASTPLFASTGIESATPVPALGGEDLLTPGSSAQLLASLAVVLLVIVALGWLSRRLHRLQPKRSGRAMRVLDVLPVGARERVALVQVGSTQLVLGLAPGRVQTLHVLDPDTAQSGEAMEDSDEPAPPIAATPFASLLKR
ncbi:MAG: flagellar biosynthetic protein FliO [Pseudomonadota bacterium]